MSEPKRKVRVFRLERFKGNTHLSKVPDGEADFHGWGCDYEEFESGPGNFSTAIIERDDGTIETPQAGLVQFIERQ